LQMQCSGHCLREMGEWLECALWQQLLLEAACGGHCLREMREWILMAAPRCQFWQQLLLETACVGHCLRDGWQMHCSGHCLRKMEEWLECALWLLEAACVGHCLRDGWQMHCSGHCLREMGEWLECALWQLLLEAACGGHCLREMREWILIAAPRCQFCSQRFALWQQLLLETACGCHCLRDGWQMHCSGHCLREMEEWLECALWLLEAACVGHCLRDGWQMHCSGHCLREMGEWLECALWLLEAACGGHCLREMREWILIAEPRCQFCSQRFALWQQLLRETACGCHCLRDGLRKHRSGHCLKEMGVQHSAPVRGEWQPFALWLLLPETPESACGCHCLREMGEWMGSPTRTVALLSLCCARDSRARRCAVKERRSDCRHRTPHLRLTVPEWAGRCCAHFGGRQPPPTQLQCARMTCLRAPPHRACWLTLTPARRGPLPPLSATWSLCALQATPSELRQLPATRAVRWSTIE
jgi:hypothetical protein